MNKKYQFSKEQEVRFQLEAVRQNGRCIRYIDNPSEQLQIEAVKENGCSIEFIKNPSEELQLEAVREDGRAIQYIKNPSLEVQLAAVREDAFNIRYIDNPTNYIKSIIDVVDTSKRKVYILHEPNKEPLFSIGCQCNIDKDYFIWRIYSLDGGLEDHPYRQEYIDILERY